MATATVEDYASVSDMQRPYINQTCEVCEQGTYQLPESDQEWHLVCDECGSIYFCYTPMPHQAAFHKDPHKYKLFAGG